MVMLKKKTTVQRQLGMTKQEQRELSERRIIASTLSLIAERGVSGATLAEIGERAGYSRGLPAHLFGNKDALLAECMRRLMVDYWVDNFPEVDELGPYGALIAAVEKWINDLTENPQLPRAHLLLLQEAVSAVAKTNYPQFVPIAQKFVSGSEQRFYSYIVAGQEAGELRKQVDARFEAILIHTTLRGVSQRWLIQPSSIDIVQFKDKFIGRLHMLLRENDGQV